MDQPDARRIFYIDAGNMSSDAVVKYVTKQINMKSK